MALVLFEPHPITTTDRATLDHVGIDANVDLVMLGRRSQDPRIPREVSLWQRRHHAARARAGDAQANVVPKGERVADPVILDKGLPARGRLHHDVWTKPPDLEAPLRIEFPEPIDRARGQDMDDGTDRKSVV